jgi:beta-phosphoglucomutase-like phosphatase (HAD superfamily)
MRSAHAAGLRLIAIPQQGFPQASDALALADAHVGSLDDVTVALVERLLLGG